MTTRPLLKDVLARALAAKDQPKQATPETTALTAKVLEGLTFYAKKIYGAKAAVYENEGTKVSILQIELKDGNSRSIGKEVLEVEFSDRAKATVTDKVVGDTRSWFDKDSEGVNFEGMEIDAAIVDVMHKMMKVSPLFKAKVDAVLGSTPAAPAAPAAEQRAPAGM